MNKIDITDLKRDCPMPELLKRLGLGQYAKPSCSSPFRSDHHASWGIFEKSGRWMFKDHATGEVGDEISILSKVNQLDPQQDFYQLLTLYRDIAQQKCPSAPSIYPQKAATKGNPDRTGFGPGAYKQLEALSNLRGITLDGLQLAQDRGVLIFGAWQGMEVYGVTDQSGRALEIRRLDGQVFPEYGCLAERKCHAIKGSQKSWPVGIYEANGCDFLAIAEGVPDFLALHQYVIQEGVIGKVGPVGMLSGSSLVHPDALVHFRGKHVRIFPHLDSAGIRAAGLWQEQLKAAGASAVDFFDFSAFSTDTGLRPKDLCEFNQAGVPKSGIFEGSVV